VLPFDYERHAAGNLLNTVSGTTLYVGEAVRGPGSPNMQWNGNFEEAAKGFGAWRAKSKDALHFDKITRKWTSG
jgi:hypothetical protein